MYSQLKILLFSLTATFSTSCLGGVDSIQRYIWSDGISVWVRDDLSFSKEMSQMHGYFWQIYIHAKAGDLSEKKLRIYAGDILEHENLSVNWCQAFFTNDIAHVEIISRVNFPEKAMPATIHIVSSLGGETQDFEDLAKHPEKIGSPVYFDGRLTNEMQIFHSGQKFILHFPDLGAATRDLSDFDQFKALFDFATINKVVGLKNDQKYVCDVESKSRISLLDWFSGPFKKEGPTITELRTLNTKKPLSENDLISLCTTMQVAKGGNYELEHFK
jgi:hypothetical protein